MSKVTEKIKTRSKPTPSENFNSQLLQDVPKKRRVPYLSVDFNYFTPPN
jgi:hypothetical protein